MITFKGTVFRAHNPRWAFAPASGEGAARFGGRFNAVGNPALYTSLHLETAWLEAQQGFAFKAQPMTMCAYDVDCAGIADLTDEATLGQLSISRADLACPWEAVRSAGGHPPSWRVSDDLRAAGYAGLVARSFAPGATGRDVNIVFWTWGPDLPHKVRVIDEHGRLPKNDQSWN